MSPPELAPPTRPFSQGQAFGGCRCMGDPMSCPGLAGSWGLSCHPCPLGSKESFGGAGAQNPLPAERRVGLGGFPWGTWRVQVSWYPGGGEGGGAAIVPVVDSPCPAPRTPVPAAGLCVCPPPALPCAAAPAGVSTRPLLPPLSPPAPARDRQGEGQRPPGTATVPRPPLPARHHRVLRKAWEKALGSPGEQRDTLGGQSITSGGGSHLRGRGEGDIGPQATERCGVRMHRWSQEQGMLPPESHVSHAQPHMAQGTCPPAVPLPRRLLPLVSSHHHRLCSPPHLRCSLCSVLPVALQRSTD